MGAIDHDPFAQGDAPPPFLAGGDLPDRAPLRITVQPDAPAAQPKWVPIDHDPFAPVGQAEDIAKSAGLGMAKGTVALAGAPGDIRETMAHAASWLSGKLGYEIAPDKLSAAIRIANGPLLGGPTSSDIKGQIGNPDELYQPQTRAGRYAETIGEFVPGAVGGPGGIARNAIRYAAVPGAMSEAVGERVKGSWVEPYARAGTAAVAGGIGAIVSRPRTAEQALRQRLPAGFDPAAVDRAERLITDARARGVDLTWPEALEQVAPGTRLTDTQRVLEAAPGSQTHMGEFFAQRPAQIENAARGEFGAIGPAATEPAMIGPRAGRLAGDELRDVRQTINAAAEPHYTAAETTRLDATTMARVRALPGYEEARDTVRNTPQLARYVQGLPEDSVGFLNEVKKQLDTMGRNAAGPMNAQRNQQVASGYGGDAKAVRAAAVRRSPEYETALALEAFGREHILQPLMKGPLGQLAKRDITTQKAINALFPKDPIANSAQEVTTAVSALARRNPRVAAELVRAHVESTFEAAANNRGRTPEAAQFTGASFASDLTGSPVIDTARNANLEAAIRALPNGDATWAGFDRFMEIARATGTRQNVGSRTAFNAKEVEDLSRGRISSEGAKVAAAPQRLLSALGDSWDRWQLGRNLNELAHILTDPASGRLLRAIAQRPATARESQIFAARLAIMSYETFANKSPESPNANKNQGR